MLAKVLYVSSSGKTAIIAVEKTMSGVVLPVATGFIKITESKEVGDTFELPDSLNLSTEDRTLKDEETGEVRTFTWIKVA